MTSANPLNWYKNIETFEMDPIYEINSQFAHYVLLYTHMQQMLTN